MRVTMIHKILRDIACFNLWISPMHGFRLIVLALAGKDRTKVVDGERFWMFWP